MHYVCLQCLLELFIDAGKTILVRNRTVIDPDKLGVCDQCRMRPATHELEIKRDGPTFSIIVLPKET